MLNAKLGMKISTYLRFDSWHSHGVVADVYPRRVICDSGIGSHSKVASVIRGNDWISPHARSENLGSILSAPCSNAVPRSEVADMVISTGSRSGLFPQADS